MGFASVKEVIRRFLGLEDRFQAIFVLFRAFYWNFRQELSMQFGNGVGIWGRQKASKAA